MTSEMTPDGSTEYRGIVRCHETDKPLQNAKVVVRRIVSKKPLLETTHQTDEGGYYWFQV